MKTLALLLALALTVSESHSQTGKLEWDDFNGSPFYTNRYELSGKTPFMALSGGMAMLDRYSVTTPIEDQMSFLVQLGMESYQDSRRSELIKRHEVSGLYVGFNKAPDPTVLAVVPEGSAPIASTYAMDIWRFGTSDEDAYAYLFGKDGLQGVYLESGCSVLSWSVPDVKSITTDSIQNPHIERFDGLHFGESMQASVDFRVAEPLSLKVNYYWSQIYPRHMFWFWGLSLVIEEIARGSMNLFISSIAKSSPAAVPIMNFILQNGLAFGFKALRQNKMNWPFDTEAPLNVMGYSATAVIHF